MKKLVFVALLGLLSFTAFGQVPDSVYIKENYDKQEVYITMRDGVKLFTSIYTPKDKSTLFPFLMQRTCYSVAPYGPAKFRRNLGPSKFLMKDKYIFVYQDVRGRWMSEGVFTNMTPNIPGNDKKNKTAVDEASDTFDTIDWLLKNIKGNNGKVGQWGISYPGFYTAASIPDAHPALKASSPQAPVSDFYFDDFHHNGAFLQSYVAAFGVFGYQHDKPTDKSWYNDKMKRLMDEQAKDGYEFNLALGPLKNADKYHHDNFFWKETVEHPNYDEFWQKRNILPHLTNVNHAVMTVGGWYDAEDLYGPLNIYKKIEASSPAAMNTIVMGPWSHGDWARETGFQQVFDVELAQLTRGREVVARAHAVDGAGREERDDVDVARGPAAVVRGIARLRRQAASGAARVGTLPRIAGIHGRGRDPGVVEITDRHVAAAAGDEGRGDVREVRAHGGRTPAQIVAQIIAKRGVDAATF
jgi:hypothetical protein